MRRGLWLATVGVVVLAGCQEATEGRYEPAQTASDAATSAEMAAVAPEGPVRAVAPVSADDRAEGGLAMPSLPVGIEASPLAPVARIAYAFNYGLSVPRERGAELMSRHELTCAAAGPGFCQVVSAQADWTSRDPAGRLELRGQPAWVDRFRAGLAMDAQNAGGQLDTALTEGENLSRPIDIEETGAATSATLVERMRELRARSGGTLAQKLEVERELAQLQRQYDAHQLALRELNDRVMSARLTIDYREGGVMGANSPTRPVASALSDALGLSMAVLGVLIRLGSVMLPVAAIAALVWWGMRRRRPKAA